MHIKTIATAALVAATMGFTGVAYAQTMIGNQNVSEADHQRVQNYCEDLNTTENQAVQGTDDVTPAEGAEVPADEVATATTGEGGELGAVDLDQVTLENCIEAGFVARVGG